jgi:hypothetical protein
MTTSRGNHKAVPAAFRRLASVNAAGIGNAKDRWLSICSGGQPLDEALGPIFRATCSYSIGQVLETIFTERTRSSGWLALDPLLGGVAGGVVPVPVADDALGIVPVISI